ncbi:RloB family protein [Myroides sp. M-43]|uniref:RloB domain-containing protein n=1 Tax=Myroides oncorhynchi TaxID=2893756 RepID=UPI001E2BB7CF|nr:RloB family protein [Myroides oncorhynchi]
MRNLSYYEYLSKKLDLNYSKVGKERKQCEAMYSILADKGSIDLAIKNAKRLYETQMELSYSQQNPVTLVYQLVELLRENSRK